MPKKNKLTLILALLLTLVVAAVAGAAATWWGMNSTKSANSKSESKPVEKPVDAAAQKYVSLDKVIVMLHKNSGETTQHYLAADLVFKTTEEKEKLVKSHLPLLRSEAVKILSDYTMEKAESMTVTQLAAAIDRVLDERYAREQQVRPFSEVMIGKLIIE